MSNRITRYRKSKEITSKKSVKTFRRSRRRVQLEFLTIDYIHVYIYICYIRASLWQRKNTKRIRNNNTCVGCRRKRRVEKNRKIAFSRKTPFTVLSKRKHMTKTSLKRSARTTQPPFERGILCEYMVKRVVCTVDIQGTPNLGVSCETGVGLYPCP